MSANTIQKTQEILKEKWLSFFDQFTQSNRGRAIALEVANEEIGDETLVKQSPLASITYDPMTKGNDVVIAIGHDMVTYSHTVIAPKAIWVATDSSNQAIALEIVDHSGTQTILQFIQ